MFRGERLYIGKEVTFILGGRVISGMVTYAQEPEWIIPVSKTETPPCSPTTGYQKECPTQTESGTLNTHIVLFVANVSDELASAISEGPVQTSNIVRIEDKRVLRHIGTARLSLKLRLEVTEGGGSLFFRGFNSTKDNGYYWI